MDRRNTPMGKDLLSPACNSKVIPIVLNLWKGWEAYAPILPLGQRKVP